MKLGLLPAFMKTQKPSIYTEKYPGRQFGPGYFSVYCASFTREPARSPHTFRRSDRADLGKASGQPLWATSTISWSPDWCTRNGSLVRTPRPTWVCPSKLAPNLVSLNVLYPVMFTPGSALPAVPA